MRPIKASTRHDGATRGAYKAGDFHVRGRRQLQSDRNRWIIFLRDERNAWEIQLQPAHALELANRLVDAVEARDAEGAR